MTSGARTAWLVAPLLTALVSAASTYHFESVADGGRGLQRFDAAQLRQLQKLNRVDLDHLARQQRIVVPDRWSDDPLADSPLPIAYESASGVAKLLVVQQPWQVFGGYEHGVLVRWGPISSGRRGSQTPPGLFRLNWKSQGRHSTVNPEWFMPWYFNFGNVEGLSLHQYALPGLPASHSCVRLLEDDARWVYEWGDGWTLDPSGRRALVEGTPVFIVGAYDFTAPPPWRSIERLGGSVTLPPLPASYGATAS